MTTILAIDTSGKSCGVALWQARRNNPAGVVLASERRPMTRGHAEAVVGMMETQLERASCLMQDVDLIGVVTGPGTFTGVRIGLAAAAGVALATDIRIVGVNAFDALATGAVSGLHWMQAARRHLGEDGEADGSLLVAIDSRRTEMFLRRYALQRSGRDWTVTRSDAIQCVQPVACSLPADPGRSAADSVLAVVGDGATRFCLEHPDFSSEHRQQPTAIDPGVVARLAWEQRDSASREPPSPDYLRAPDADRAPPPRDITPIMSDP